jgi:hypothetical protein
MTAGQRAPIRSSRVDMNIPITTTPSGTIHFVVCAAASGRGAGLAGGEGGEGGEGGRNSGGEGGVCVDRLPASTSSSARGRGATSTPPPAVLP